MCPFSQLAHEDVRQHPPISLCGAARDRSSVCVDGQWRAQAMVSSQGASYYLVGSEFRGKRSLSGTTLANNNDTLKDKGKEERQQQQQQQQCPKGCPCAASGLTPSVHCSSVV